MFILGRDGAGNNAFLVTFPDSAQKVNLAQSSAVSVTIPSGSPSYSITLQYEVGTSVFVAINGTAEVPSSASFSSTNSMLNPPGLYLPKAGTLSFITPDTTAYVIVNFYANSTTGF